MPVDLSLAKRVQQALTNESGLTISGIAAAVEVPESEVLTVLDEYRVEPNGDITHVGAGGGGGWVV